MIHLEGRGNNAQHIGIAQDCPSRVVGTGQPLETLPKGVAILNAWVEASGQFQGGPQPGAGPVDRGRRQLAGEPIAPRPQVGCRE
jgi:hypothetical protein